MKKLVLALAFILAGAPAFAQTDGAQGYWSKNVSNPTFGGIANFTGQVSLADGSAGSPSLRFTTDTDTGLFVFPSNQGIGLFTANGGNAAGWYGNGIVLSSAGLVSWVSAAIGSSAVDVSLQRGAADRLDLATGDSFFIVNGGLGVGVAPGAAGTATVSGAQVTAGVGTGITVNSNGFIQRAVYKVTVDRTAFICAALTCDLTIATLPAKANVVTVIGDLTQVFACSVTCTTATLSLTLGRSAGGTQYLLSFDADAAIAIFGDADGELGVDLARASAVQGGGVANWSGTAPFSLRLTSGTGNIGTGAATNLSTGSITFYLVTERMP